MEHKLSQRNQQIRNRLNSIYILLALFVKKPSNHIDLKKIERELDLINYELKFVFDNNKNKSRIVTTDYFIC